MVGSSGGLMAKLPPWLAAGLKNGRQWKTFVRCLVTLLAALVLMLDNKSLQLQGQAAFFSLIIAVILPPSFPLSLFILAFMTMGLGMLTGWAWSCAAMAAALKARDQLLLQSQIERANSGLTSGQNPEAQFQASIFHGDFLDPRSSTVFAVFFFVGAYVFGWLKAAKPRLTLFSLFGTIIMDVQCLYGPLFPVEQYELPRIILLPTAFYFAIALAATTLVFPQSLNHQLTTAMINTALRPLLSQLKLQDEILQGSPSDVKHIEEQAGRARALRKGMIGAINALQGQMSLLQLEVTRGQISGTNLARVFERLKKVISFSHVLASFSILLEQDHKSKDRVEAHHVHVKQARANAEKYRKDGTSLDDLFPILGSSTRDLRTALEKGIEEVIEWLGVVNHSRWSAPPKDAAGIASREAALDRVQTALAEFRKTKHFELLDQVRDLFDASGHLKPGSREIIRWSSISLFRCHVFTTSLIGLSGFVVELLELLLTIERENPRARLQWPAAFTKMLAKAVNDHDANANPLEIGKGPPGDSSSEITLVNPKARTYPKNADAEDPRNALQRLGRKSASLWSHLVSPQGIFALKYGLVSVALFVPSVCHSSAFFVYSNRGLWVVIMAQMALAVYTGEQIIAFVIRVVGTAIGLINGMVIWYIGAPGRGHGNPYGIAAATIVFTAPFLFIRLIAPPPSMPIWMMSSVMSVFVVGYSWIDEHVVQVANAGSGAALAGRRALLVLIGFTAAFIVMLFPRPTSAKRNVRLSLARCIEGTGELYGFVVQAIEDDVEDGADDAREKDDVQRRVDRMRSRFIAQMTQVAAIEQQIAFASFEPAFRGPWPKARYEAIWRAQLGLLNALVLLGSTYARLAPSWARRLERTNLMNPDFITDCLHHFYLLHQSLASGTHLPVNVSILERLAYHWNHKLPHTRAWHGGEPSFEQQEEDQALAALGEPLTWDLCHDEQMALFAAATVAMTYVASGLEDLTREVVGLVGEAEFSGLSRARERRSQV